MLRWAVRYLVIAVVVAAAFAMLHERAARQFEVAARDAASDRADRHARGATPDHDGGDAGDVEQIIEAGPHGHFLVEASVNGVPIDFMVDTGASDIVLSPQDASALGFASGTNNAPPGWFWVGEHGPELMRFAGGEQVLPHMASVAKAQSLAALGVPSVPSVPRLPGVSSALKSGGLQLQLSWAGTSDQVTNAIVSGLQAHVIGATGGDVQAAIGYGPIRLP